jgi:integrase
MCKFTNDGLVIKLQHSKTDQEGMGETKGIPYGSTPSTCPVRALRAWLDAAGISAGPIFRSVAKGGRTVRQGRLDPGSVARIIKRAAARAGLPDADDFSGHSLRSGLATEAARSGATDNMIADQTGHTDVRSVKRYIRRGRRFTDNILNTIDL